MRLSGCVPHKGEETAMTETTNKALLSVVGPCYNESEVLRMFYQELRAVLDKLPNVESEILFVDDGSSDDTLSQLNHLAQENPAVRVCSLSRNFGHQSALPAGLDRGVGEAVVMMAAYLQHPPQFLIKHP